MNIWKIIYKLLEKDVNLYLLTVAQSKGSAPGRRGFKMIVAANGEISGSIGGGVMEFNMVEKAKALLHDNITQQHCYKQDHRINSDTSSGMICSGSQSIIFNYLTKDDLMLVSACVQTPLMIELSEKGLTSIDLDNKEYFRMKFVDTWRYSELINQQQVVRIFGAGHVSVPTSDLLSKLGYDVYLYDNRNDINTYNNNCFVKEKSIINYEEVLSLVKFDNTDIVLLMTHKFTEDKLLLSKLVGKEIKYLGCLGSKSKIKKMYRDLFLLGISKDILEKVYAPIGLDINSKTTQEIAISIVAEIIKEKNS